ncbi:hypothetical protein KAF25_004098 [Fusarium avenaceum]|uniref:AMP-dependent synthetase/ligase domain-containing protein n=1 Tax=Fusarium avenaceum TaxID=40199 RepID=A0A9P7KU49_9HYPO|nr:hypothetical protein KAF25_004098 [Fusarium avenaceum]
MRSFHTPLTVIENLSRNRGDLPAVRYADAGLVNNGYKTISYAEYWNDIENAANLWLSILSKAGVAKGSVVGLWMKGWSYQDLLHYLSLQRAGFIPQLFSLRMTDPSMIFELMGKSKASALIHEPSCETLVPGCPVPTLSTDVWDTIPAPDTQLDRTTTSLNPDQVSVIFHTSGSTSGMPKLVPATVKWMDCLIRKSKPGLGSDPQMVCNLMGSHAHLGNTINLTTVIAKAGCLIPPTSVPYPTSELQSMISEGGLTVLNIFPALLSNILRDAHQDEKLVQQLQSLESIEHAGQILEPADDAWARGQGINLLNKYGSTEIGLSMLSTKASPYLVPFPESGCDFIPLGEVSSSPDQLLELVIPPEADDCPHSSLRNELDGKFHTGDVFQRIGDNQYLYKGRVDDRIKMQLSLICDAGSLESETMQVCERDLISAVSVIGSGRPTPAMVVEPKNDDILSSGAEKLLEFKMQIVGRIAPFHKRKYLHERIDHARLVFVVPQGTLPRTAKGNVMRKAVEKQFSKELDEAY